MDNINVMKAISIAYGIPLLALMFGTISSFFILKNIGVVKGLEVYSFFTGILFTAGAYLFLRFKDRSIRDSRKYMPTITQILIHPEGQGLKELLK